MNDDSLPQDAILTAEQKKRLVADTLAEQFTEGRIRRDALELSARDPHD